MHRHLKERDRYLWRVMSFAYQNAFYFLGVSLAYIVSFILFRSPAGQRTTNRLLGIAFFSMGWYNMIYLITLTGVYAHMYWLAGWGPPLSFLISPCAYLYVRQTLKQKDGLDRKDWLHFLPFLVFFFDLLPFNLGLSTVSKETYVTNALHDFNQFYLQRITVIPLRWHFILRPIQAILYLCFQWRLLLQGRLGGSKRLYRWLMILTVMQTFFYLTLAALTYRGFSTGIGIYITKDYQMLMYVLYICFLAVTLTLLSYPEALYGLARDRDRGEPVTIATIPVTIPKVAGPEPEPEQPRPVNGKVISQYLPILEAHLETDKPWLQAKWSIQDMAVATRIPVHQLSYIINQHYKVRYTDLMNQYRVDYAKSLFAEGVWKELSLEGLGKRAGFSNRTNFFLVFKKITGQSPSEYLNTLKSKDLG
jgi:AraC-like DNA-binding protein